MKSPSVVPFKFQHNGKEKEVSPAFHFASPTGLGFDPSSVVYRPQNGPQRAQSCALGFKISSCLGEVTKMCLPEILEVGERFKN